MLMTSCRFVPPVRGPEMWEEETATRAGLEGSEYVVSVVVYVYGRWPERSTLLASLGCEKQTESEY